MSNRKQSHDFIVQGSILAAAAIIAKAIGVIYRVPLTNIIGDSGNSYYSTANEIYSIILMISSFSLPLAVSRMMSERINRGEIRNAGRVFSCAMRFAVISGLIMSVLTWALAGVLTKYVMNFELARYGLQVIAPAILIFAITGTFRRFFQGFGNMVPTAISQVIEQIINAILSVVCASMLYRYGLRQAALYDNELLAPAWGAAGGTFGTVGSVLVAMIFMMIVYRINRRSFQRMAAKDRTEYRESSREIYHALMLTILPIILSTLVYNISNVVDQGIFNAILKGQGYTEKQYSIIWGIYVGKFRVLMNVVLSLASSIGPAIVPSLTHSVESREAKREAAGKISAAIRFTMIFSIPCAVGLGALGGPIITMLFHPESGLPLSEGIMRAGVPMIILYALSTLTTAILQGMGRLKEPLVHCCIALGIHLAALYVLMRHFSLNIYGVIIANILFALIICILNAMTIYRTIRYRQEWMYTFVIPLACSAIMGFAAYLVYSLFNLFCGNTISTVIAILAGAVIYLFSMIALRGLSAEDIRMIPGGYKIIRFMQDRGLMR